MLLAYTAGGERVWEYDMVTNSSRWTLLRPRHSGQRDQGAGCQAHGHGESGGAPTLEVARSPRSRASRFAYGSASSAAVRAASNSSPGTQDGISSASVTARVL